MSLSSCATVLVVRTLARIHQLAGLTLICTAGVCSVAQAQSGLAASYPNDVGIDNDPAVVFVEDFEEASIANMVARWDLGRQPELMSFTADVPSNSGGSQALYIEGGWADLYRRLLPGYQRLYVRFYTKLDPSCLRVHHWPWLGGHEPPTDYPWPRAGLKPVGDERWSTGVEPYYVNGSPPWRWAFYTYWKDMRIDLDGNYWGNTFHNDPAVPANRGEWVAVEFMVVMNDPPSASNGEQAFWIDGVKGSHQGLGFPNGYWDRSNIFEQDAASPAFEGFQWRTTSALNINYLWLEHFVDSDPGCEAWFDDLVVATEYIGPTVTSSSPPSDGAGGNDGGGTSGDVTPGDDSSGDVTPGGDPPASDVDNETGSLQGGCHCGSGAADLGVISAALVGVWLWRRNGRRLRAAVSTNS